MDTQRCELDEISRVCPEVDDAQSLIYLPVCPKDNLYYESRGWTGDNRFVRILRDTWTKLPPYAREILVAYWAEIGECLIPGRPRMPRIVVQLQPFPMPPGLPSYGVACCTGRGREFAFRANWICCMPDVQMSTAIAHEFAHSYLYAVEAHGPDDPPPLREFDVEGTLDDWGFDEAEFVDWLNDNKHSFECPNCGTTIVGPQSSWERCCECHATYRISHDGEAAVTDGQR